MIEKQVFVESPLGSAPEHILILCGFVILWFGNSFLPQPSPILLSSDFLAARIHFDQNEDESRGTKRHR